MPENKDYMIHHEEMGSIQISEDVVASIATGAALEVEHVTGLQGANVADFMGGKKMHNELCVFKVENFIVLKYMYVCETLHSQ